MKIGFYPKLALTRLMHSQTAYTLQIEPTSIVITIATFSFIFVLLFFNALRQIHFANTISLVRSQLLPTLKGSGLAKGPVTR